MTDMPSQGSSFIPKAGAGPVRKTRSVKRVYLLSYISNIVFFSVLFAVIGIYVYAALIDRSLAQVQADLDTARSRFGIEDIQRIKLLDKRLSTASSLLNGSTAPSSIFASIESVVADNIVFSGMTYRQLPNNKYELTLTGRADDFNQIIKQNEILTSDNLLRGANITAFDYSIGGDESAVFAGGGEAVLTFVFSDINDVSEIPYEPTLPDVIESPTDIEVIEVGPSVDESAEQGVTETDSSTTDTNQ